LNQASPSLHFTASFKEDSTRNVLSGGAQYGTEHRTIKEYLRPILVAHTCNPSYLGRLRLGVLQFKASPGKKV
jgi:hypothetical protein